ncbi:MAG: ABC transporter substrate-binding protein [candidate division WOR-3 bacterium]|nr:MAG: ABC transporter substrate-binding protein [candidate division WOR-3 bacterium]
MVGEARGWLCIVLALAVLGCPSTGPTASDDPVAGKKTGVTFWHAMGGPLGDALRTMVEEFEERSPDIDITLVSMGGYSSLSQKLMSAVQVDAPPNMAQMYESWTTQFHELNKLIPLDSFVTSPGGLTGEEFGDFYPGFLADNSWDGRLVTMPFNKSVPVFFYNVEMLRQAGYDEFPKTWPEFRVMVKDLTERDKGIIGTVGGVNEWQFGCMLRQLGGDFIDEENGKALFNSDAGIRAARFQYDLMAVDSSAVFGAGYDPQNDFLAGKIACIWGTSVSWAYMEDKMTFPVGIAAVPSWDRPDVISFGTNIGVFRTGSPGQAAACWEFIRWFTSTERQAEWAARTSYVPARRSSLQYPEYARMIEEISGLKDQLAQLEYMSFEPRSEQWSNGRKILTAALEKIMRGRMSAKEALDEAAALVEKELRR